MNSSKTSIPVMQTVLISALLFILFMILADLVPVAFNHLSTDGWSTLPDALLSYMLHEMHWLVKIVGTVVFAASQWYVTRDRSA